LKPSDGVDPLTNDEFVGYLRSALHKLYDPTYLRRSPLAKLLGFSTEFDTASGLQQLLTEAILALKPADDEPAQSVAWRIYDTLSLQYLRQYPKNMVATQLGISERQLRREQRLALETLAQYIRKHHKISPQRVLSELPEKRLDRPEPLVPETLDTELNWLKKSMYEQRSSLVDILHTVDELARPLAQQFQVTLELNIEPTVADVSVDQLVIQNILLTILSVSIPRSNPGPVFIRATRQGKSPKISVAVNHLHDPSEPFSNRENTSLGTAQQLAAYYGAQLDVAQSSEELTVTLSLPALEQIPILVIDDNADWLNLLKRYAVGSNYDVIGTRDPETALNLAANLQPAVIFLDVMMPNVDGWQIISELRHEQSTSHIPIVICSILPLEELVLSLGVDAFMQKPITQRQFIAMLDQQINALG
jgi:CheY-like chemotaxis protein